MTTAGQFLRERIIEGIAAFVAYAIAVVWLTSPLFDNPTSTLLDGKSIGFWILGPNIDLFIWTLSWDLHALTTQPLSFFDANILHPTQGTLAAVFPRLGHLPIFGPLRLITDNPVAANQLTMLVNFALSGAAVFALLRDCGCRRTAAFFGGFIYALCPARLGSAMTPAVIAGQYLPIGLMFLRRAAEAPGWRYVATATVFFVWQASCALAYAFIVPLVAISAVLATALARRPLACVGRIAVVALLSTAAVGLLLAPNVVAVLRGALQDPSEIGTTAYFSLGAAHSWRDYLVRDTFFAVDGKSNSLASPLYLGWTTLLAALLAVVTRRRAGQLPVVGTLALSAAFAAALTFGHGDTALALPWNLLAKVSFGISTLLMPSQLGFLVLLTASVLAGLGLHRALDGMPRGWLPRLVGAALVVLVAWEFRLLRGEHGIAVIARSPYPPRIYSILEEQPAGTLLEIPVNHCHLESIITQRRAMFDSTFHWRPMLNGLGELLPATRNEIESLVATMPDPRAMRLLARIADLRHIVAQTSLMPVAERREWLNVEGIKELAFADGRLLLEVTGDHGPPLTDRFRSLARQRTTLLDTPVAPVPEMGQVMEISVELDGATAVPILPIRAVALIRNPSDHAWPVLGGSRRERVEIAHYWEDASGKRLAGEVGRSPLPFDLAPGESVAVPFCASAPVAQGTVYMRAAVVQGDRWFRGEPARVPVELHPYRRVDPG